jgi:hypothetical protein
LGGWKVHAQGISCLAEHRGINQTRTKLGRIIFRKARDIVVSHSPFLFIHWLTHLTDRRRIPQTHGNSFVRDSLFTGNRK